MHMDVSSTGVKTVEPHSSSVIANKAITVQHVASVTPFNIDKLDHLN